MEVCCVQLECVTAEKRVELQSTLKGIVAGTLGANAATPLGLAVSAYIRPRVAAKRGNPGLSYVTASRYPVAKIWRLRIVKSSGMLWSLWSRIRGWVCA